MIVPFKPVYFEKATRRFKYIIIHDLSCRFANLDKAKVDSKKSVASTLRGFNWVFNNEHDLPYHFLCERIGEDYETIMGRPFQYFCIFDDIKSEFIPSIHIAVAGLYSFTSQPTNRAYQQVGYRAISPLMKWFKIQISNVYLHHEVSNDKDHSCPGAMFNKNKLLAATKPMILMK